MHVCVLCIILWINSDYFPNYDWLIEFCSGTELTVFWVVGAAFYNFMLSDVNVRVAKYVHFLGAFAAVCCKQFASYFHHVCLSIRLRVCSGMRISVPAVCSNLYWGALLNFVDIFQFWLKWNMSNGHVPWRPSVFLDTVAAQLAVCLSERRYSQEEPV